MAIKNIFARNRLKDILQTSRGLDSQYGHRPHFMYGATTQNLVDLITRGLTLTKFRFNLEFWCHVPYWLRNGIHPLPTQILPCIDTQSRWIARSLANLSMVLEEEHHPFTRLFKVTFLAFKFITRLRSEAKDWQESSSLSNENFIITQIFCRAWISTGYSWNVIATHGSCFQNFPGSSRFDPLQWPNWSVFAFCIWT